MLNYRNFKPTLYQKLKWRFDSVAAFFSDFTIGVENIITWLPVIWKDRDWDRNSTYDVLKFKIQKQAKYIAKHDRYTEAERDVRIMNLVCKLIDRVKDEYYEMESMDYHQVKNTWVESDLIYEGEKTFEILSETISEHFDDYFKKYPRQYKRAVSGELNRFVRYDDESKNKEVYALEIGIENGLRCRKLLFKILEENINKWWD